jgi:AcrR family transcriptional regulator
MISVQRQKTTMSERKPRPAPAREAYHHGDLRAALIEATEALLAERGPGGFSLREVARRLGVSPAAPAHHFGSAEGLLAAVATLAFEGLTAELEAGNRRGADDPLARLREQGVGYVSFALRHPGRFDLMFRCVAEPDEALAKAALAAFEKLETGVRDWLGAASGAPLTAAQRQTLLAVWSIVHGFAHLALAGQFDRQLGGRGREVLLREVLPGMLQQQLQGLAPPPQAARRPAPRATSGSR